MMNFFTKLLTPVFIALGMVNPTSVIETPTLDVQVQQELIELRQKVQELEGQNEPEAQETEGAIVETKPVEVKKEVVVTKPTPVVRPVVKAFEENEFEDLIDWTLEGSVIPIFEDNIEIFQSGYNAIDSAIEDDKGNLVNMYQYSNDPGMKKLIVATEEYLDAGEDAKYLLSSLVRNYEGLIESIEDKNYIAHELYSKELDDLESKKDFLIDDFYQKQTKKENVATELISNS
jgi:hypothetical protein